MKKQETSIYNEFCGNIKDRLFDENEMYDYIESYAKNAFWSSLTISFFYDIEFFTI